MRKNNRKKTVRATTTYPAETYTALEKIAKRNGVSVAWVVRQAVERYLEAQMPLFKGKL